MKNEKKGLERPKFIKVMDKDQVANLHKQPCIDPVAFPINISQS